jgi:acyl-CoA synthetase (AMP-forming)/AMP-acid ligase II
VLPTDGATGDSGAMTLLQPDLLRRLADEFPDGVAWRNLDDRSELTLQQWHRRSNELARGLLGLGLARGDRVALLIGPDEPFEWLVSYMAIHKAGAVAVPLLSRLGPAELDRVLRHAEPRLLLCSGAPGGLRAPAPIVVSTRPDGSVAWSELLSGDDAELDQAIGPDDVADIMYTSGTTGEPKGVVTRHGGLATIDRVPSAWLGLGFLTSSPFATTSGSLLICGPMRGGLAGWTLPRFDPEHWMRAVERDRPVAAFLVPAMVELIVAAPRFEASDLSSLAVVNIGSAPIASATLRRFGAGLPNADVLCGYGMTEFGAVTAMPMGDRGRHQGSVGLPLPGVEVRVLGEDGSPLPTGDAGQIAIGGSRTRRTYYKDEAGSRDTWEDGWLLSGDLGYLDGDGHLWIVGRQKEMIIRGGHNVVPGEVEAALFEHPAVAEAAVAGVPHDVLGEDVVAWVVLRQDTPLDELRAFLLARLADFKVPRRITVVDALPRNESGKVLKSQLVSGEGPRSGV